MRITHVTDFWLPRLGGLELQVADLASQQAAAGHEVTVVTSTPGEGVPERPGVDVVRLSDGLRRPHALHPAAVLAGPRAVRATAPDVVHVHLGVGTPLAFWVLRQSSGAGVPTAATVHSFWYRVHAVFRALDVPGGFTRRPIAWSAVSDAAAGPVRRMVSDPVTVVPNGADVHEWVVPHAAREEDDVLLVAVMRLARRKRPLPLLAMAREVRARVPRDVRLRLLVVGDGPLRDDVQREVDARGMADWVELTGPRTRAQIRDLYARADVFLAPAELESFGIAALEARCAGVPVVARRASGIAEFVRHGEDGLLAADDAEMTDLLVDLATDPVLRKQLHGVPPPEHLDWPQALGTVQDLYARAGAPVAAGSPR